MAKNYTYAEAVAIIAEGTNLEEIFDIGRRFPLLVQKTAVVAAKAGESFVDLMSFMPDYLTANKVNTSIKKTMEAGAEEDSEEEDADESTETETETETETDYDSMTAKELWDILGKAGKRGTAKSKKKADLVAAAKALANGDAEEEEEVEEEEVGKYDGKSAVELFKECKARKIKAEPKKPAKYYVNLLTKADAAEEAEADDDDDDWDI